MSGDARDDDRDEHLMRYALQHPREFLKATNGVYSEAELRARAASVARHPATADPLGVLYEEIKETRFSPLNVTVDVLDLLEHFDGDKAKTFAFLGELKDLMSS